MSTIVLRSQVALSAIFVTRASEFFRNNFHQGFLVLSGSLLLKLKRNSSVDGCSNELPMKDLFLHKLVSLLLPKTLT